MVGDVKRQPQRRTRRAERAEQTRRRILDAATALFTERGYSSTTIEAIAGQADVAVETVYSRFRDKANLLGAILEPAIVGDDDGRDVLDRPEMVEIRSCPDQHTQLLLLARFSRSILERTHTAHRILQSAAGSDASAAEMQRRDLMRRCDTQRAYIDILLGTGPLRDGLTRDAAADTYSALANPTTYAFLVQERSWTPDRFEHWLADSLTQLILA